MTCIESGDLTEGNITGKMLRFALPLIFGNLLQQCYNIADTLIVGRVIGTDALAAVGASYSLMIFLTSVFTGLSMGCSTIFSMKFGARNLPGLRKSMFTSLIVVTGTAAVLNIVSLIFLDGIVSLLQIPYEIRQITSEYLSTVFWGMIPVCIYNFYAFLLRAIGNSVIPLLFLLISVTLNIGLDLLLITVFSLGVGGAAWATLISQTVSAAGILIYTETKFPELHLRKDDCILERSALKEVLSYSFLTCAQQSVMNFGILMVQGLVNSFGTAVMAAFAAAVKIDSFAYMPVQDFGNAFSTFVAQNFGAGKKDRIAAGIRKAAVTTAAFSLAVSALVFVFAPWLMSLFVPPGETEIVNIGAEYLRIEGSFYIGIGCLFLLYGFYRAVAKPSMSLVLTTISLGTRVLLAYALASVPAIGYTGIWWSVPAGWFLADLAGIWYGIRKRNSIRDNCPEPR